MTYQLPCPDYSYTGLQAKPVIRSDADSTASGSASTGSDDALR
jgi:hypothetical protein